MRQTACILAIKAKVFGRLLIALAVSSASLCYGQYDFVDPGHMPPCGEKVHQEIRPFIEHIFCWKDWEVAASVETRQMMLENFIGEQKPGRPAEASDTDTMDSISAITIGPKSIHVIDYDLDGNNDFIYAMWEPFRKRYSTHFWLNVEGKWSFDFKMEGKIEEMGITDGKPWFIVYHHLCCGDYTGYVKKIVPSDKPGPSFQVSEKYAFTENFGEFGRRLEKEINFDQNISVSFINQDTLFTTTSTLHPKILKERRRFNPALAFAEEARGTILTEIVDRQGQKWYFVKLEPIVQKLASAFSRDHRIGTIKIPESEIQYMGWVRADNNNLIISP